MEQPVKLVEMPEAGGIVEVEVTEPLPGTGVADSTYKIEGTVKMFGAIGSLPWVYAEAKRKEWYKPEVAEEVSYERGFPMPISGEFSITFRPEKAGDYEVTVVATPAPLSLPVIGVFPIVGRSDVMKVAISEAPPAAFRFSAVSVDGNPITLTDKDVDAKLLLDKTTADYLEINPSFEWTGPRKDVVISIKVGYKRLLDFEPKTGAYTQSVTLPASLEVYEGSLEQPLKIPLTACADVSDGAIEVVAKIPGEADYISHIWNVYATKLPPENFDLTRPTPSVFEPAPGTEITITCPVTSRRAIAVDARAKVIIYEGSFLPGHGTKLKEYDSGVFHIVPNESKNVVIHHLTVMGTIDRRDVEVEIYIDTQLVKQSEWDDIYYVGMPPEEVIDFELTRPSVSPAGITPGTPITLTCLVISACTKEQSVTAKVKIYEGSFYAGHGALITTKTSPSFSIAPGQTYGIIISHTAIAGTIDRRDVKVEIYIAGQLVKEDEWDDVYYVTGVAPPPPLEAPKVETLAATEISHDSATLKGRLIDTGYWSNVDCYFDWGKTTGYGRETPKIRMYEGQEGQTFFAELLHQLEPDTTYHFRTAVLPIGDRSEGIVGYGQDMSFRTAKEVVVGFTMRVEHPPAGSVQWRAGCIAGGTLPYIPSALPLYSVWEWKGSVPDYDAPFFIVALGPYQNGFAPSLQADQFPLRLKVGKNYVWDFAVHEMRDADTGEVLIKTWWG